MTRGAHSGTPGGWLDDMVIVLRDAVAITAMSSAVGLLANLVHPEAIPFIADREYEVLVPCPEPGGEVTLVQANAPVVLADDSFLVDARQKEEFDAWRLRRAINIPYDYLTLTPEEVLRDLAKTIARSGAERVMVYGDGDKPDTGEQLAKEISGYGIKHVFFVEGGAPALRASEQLGANR